VLVPHIPLLPQIMAKLQRFVWAIALYVLLVHLKQLVLLQQIEFVAMHVLLVST
jgi:hypothetical protein